MSKKVCGDPSVSIGSIKRVATSRYSLLFQLILLFFDILVKKLDCRVKRVLIGFILLTGNSIIVRFLL